jgi:hypothetical protein
MQDAAHPQTNKHRVAHGSRRRAWELLRRIQSGCTLTLAEYVHAEDLLAAVSSWEEKRALGGSERAVR